MHIFDEGGGCIQDGMKSLRKRVFFLKEGLRVGFCQTSMRNLRAENFEVEIRILHILKVLI